MLNHGAFGACPRPVLARQTELRAQMEAETVRFFLQELPPLLDASRAALAEFFCADPADMVFVPNATAGVNSVLRSLVFRPGDEILVTNHGYNACNNVASYVTQRSGATLVVVEIPTPIASSEAVTAAVLQRVTPRTRLVMVDHVTSSTGMLFPVEEIVRQLDARGIDTLIDGAHAPGMIPLNLGRLGAAYYTGNCHKWLCSPKGAGFLHVRRDRQAGIQPPVISHGFNRPRTDYSPFQDAFDWPGTNDPTPYLCLPEAIECLAGLLPGGLPALMERNRRMVLAGRDLLCQRLGLRPLCGPEMIGSIAAVELPDDSRPPQEFVEGHRVNRALLECHGIEVPVFHWPAPPKLLLRISAQAYNRPEHYERLVAALEQVLPDV